MQLYVHGEKFNQPIFFCNNISGFVEPVSFLPHESIKLRVEKQFAYVPGKCLFVKLSTGIT